MMSLSSLLRGLFAAPLLAGALVLAGPAEKAGAQRYGGCEMAAFEHANFRGASLRGRPVTPWVGERWNDKISSIVIYSGVWEFYEDIDFGGRSFRLGPGEHAFIGDRWNDKISSFRCLGGY